MWAVPKAYSNSLINKDEAYNFLKSIRGSPAYWKTISAAECQWSELLQLLYCVKFKTKRSAYSIMNLDTATKLKLIKEDPVTCARYFDYKFNTLMNLLQENNFVFWKHNVEDFYTRIEFQMRGSPHAHSFLWLKDVPLLDVKSENGAENFINFCDKFITCKYDANDPFIDFHRHDHTLTCHKGKEEVEGKCRFHFPRPVMPTTMILFSLNSSQNI